VVNEKRGIGLVIEYSKKHFPRMVNWQHWGPNGSYVGALEPCNCGVEGRDVDRRRGWLDRLEPRQRRLYRCTITATNEPRRHRELLALNRQLTRSKPDDPRNTRHAPNPNDTRRARGVKR
jgi:hypothetical protein